MKDYVSQYGRKYPELCDFFGGYFHQDWMLLYDWKEGEADWTVVVDHFREDNPKNIVIKTAKELELLLAENLTDKQFENIISEEFHSSIYAPALGFEAYLQWGESILTILKNPL